MKTKLFFSLATFASICLIVGLDAASAAKSRSSRGGSRSSFSSRSKGGSSYRSTSSRSSFNRSSSNRSFSSRSSNVRDHRSKPVVRDHRTKPIVRDHRTQPVVRDHRTKPIVRDHRTPRVNAPKPRTNPTNNGTVRPRPFPKPTAGVGAPKPRINPPKPGIGAPKPRPGVSVPKPRPGIGAPKPRPGVGVPKPRPGVGAPQPRPFPKPKPGVGAPKPRPGKPGTVRPRPFPKPNHPGHGHGHGHHGHHWHGHHGHFHRRCGWNAWWYNYCLPLRHCLPVNFRYCNWYYVTCDFTAPGGEIIQDVRWYLGVRGLILPGKGLGIEIVEPNSPAALAGLTKGMVITSVNGIALIDEAALAAAIERSGGVLDMDILDAVDGKPARVVVRMQQIITSSF